MPWLLPVSWKPISCSAPWNQGGASAKGPDGFGTGTGGACGAMTGGGAAIGGAIGAAGAAPGENFANSCADNLFAPSSALTSRQHSASIPMNISWLSTDPTDGM